jgi:hypothetical protein
MKKNILFCIIGLAGGFLFGITAKNAVELQMSLNKKKSACNDAYEVLCVQAHACTGFDVEDCDKVVKDGEMCNVELPDLQMIYLCKEELRNIECSDNMPTSCFLFME